LRDAVAASIEQLESRTLLTTVLADTADTYVRNNSYANVNFGAAPYLIVKNPNGGDARAALVEFDLSSVGTISSGILRATASLEFPEATPYTMSVFPVTQTSWVEGDGTVNSRNGNGTDTDNSPPGELTWNNGGAIINAALSSPALASTTINRYGMQTYSWDLTGYLQQQKQAGQNVVSFLFYTQEQGALWTKILSRESGGFGPSLVINGSGPSAPIATVNAPDVNNAAVQTVPVSVTYNGDLPIDPGSIATSNITVQGPAGALPVLDAAISQQGSGNSLTAIYDVAAPAGGWNAADNGFYTVIVQPNQVRDTGGGAAVSSEGTFRAYVNDTVPPSSNIFAPDVIAAGQSTYQFTVTFSDDVAIDTSWVDVDNVGVTGPGGQALTVLSAQVDNASNGTPRTATYTVAAPGGAWAAADNGAYTVDYRAAQVRDTAGNAAAPSTVTFNVAIPTTTPDNTPPTASISAPTISSGGGATQQIAVTYSDDVAIDISTIGNNDISVVGPHGRLNVTGVTLNQSANAPTVVATYTVAAPGGSWNSTDDGSYTVTLNPNKVRDTSGNPAASVSGSFDVNIPVPVPDTTPPTAAISVGNITSAGGVETVTVVYTDNIAVSAGSIDPSDLTVLAPGLGRVAVSGVTITPTQDSAQITAVYTLTAPGGSWGAEDNGNYTVELTPGAVTDTSGNAAAAPPATFTVNIATPDTIPPSASISAPDILTPGGTNEAITVTFADNVAIDISSIAAGDITVVGPSGALAVTAVNVGATQNGTPISATFAVAAPGGTWGPEDNGDYTVTLLAGTVRDTSGNTAPQTSNVFHVNATLPDTTPPSAQITAPDISSGGGATQTITVIYTDNVAVNAASIDASDISVTGPAGALPVIAVHAASGSGSPLVVTYTVSAPGGTWDAADNGSYTIALNAGQVTDLAGNPVGGTSGSFVVDITGPVTGPPTDQTFANGQTVNTQFVTEDIITEADGQILAVGHQGDLAAGQSQGVVERFNTDGTVDRTFGANGMVISTAGINEAYYSITLQGASHFLIAGTSGGDFVVARYDLAGHLDGTFGTGGRVITDFGTTADAARAVAIAPDGMIVAGGDSDGNFAFAQYDPNGHLDPNFAQSGRALFGIGAGNDGMGDLTIEGDGKIVAVGANGGTVVAVRLTASGEPDGTFGNGGLVNVLGLAALTDSGVDHSESLAIQGNGFILVANRTSNGHFGVARLNPGGALDPTFGAGGIAAANFGGNDDADSIIVQPTGEIIVIGTSLKNGTGETAVAAFDPNGSPLTTYGSGGMQTFPTGMSTTSRQLHVGDIVLRAFGTRTPDGRIVIGTSNEAVSGTTSSTLRRIPVPGAVVGASSGDETPLGTFGQVGRKRTKLVFTDLDGTRITITLVGGTGQAFQSGDRIHLVINDLGHGVTLTITGKGGDGRVSLSDVTISGTLRSMVAKNSDLFGQLHVTGAIGKLVLGNISGLVWSGDSIASVMAGDLSGNLYASGAIGKVKFANVSGTIASGSGVIGSVTAANLNSARILSGANLGTDGAIGGTNSDADSFGAGSIGTIKVTGHITSSFIGAGVNPVDSTFGNDNDVSAGPGSVIHAISAKAADSASRFEATGFGKVRLPATVNVLNDPRFRVL
jgi:uncharacterized delta-60 repeat protein